MKKKKNGWITVLLVLILLIGLGLMLYPSVSDYWNSFHQSQVIVGYDQEIADMDTGKHDEMLEAARKYNESLVQRSNYYTLTDEQEAEYYSLLNLSGSGTMGYIEIPSINCTLPIYHGTSEAVLAVGVGHIEWTSLPIGGESTHCALSSHRGLPSAKLFTDLDKVVLRDIFTLNILGETYTYEVDQILIVEPHEAQALLIEEGKDYCTLVTCTPYGINSHRMLVRGHRIENIRKAKTVYVTADAIQIKPILVAPVLAAPILLLLLIALMLPKKPKYHRGDDDDEMEAE